MGIYKSTSRIIRRTLLGALVLMLTLAASALPAAAEAFGPAFFCDAQAFSNCTDTSDPALAEDTFSCEGAVRDIASCTNQTTGESAPYCVFMGEEGSTNRDACRGIFMTLLLRFSWLLARCSANGCLSPKTEREVCR